MINANINTIHGHSAGGGATLFISNAGSGTGDGSSAANSMSLANFLNETLQPNTTVRLNKGEVYEFGEYDIEASGVVFDAAGTGDNPILRGSEDISGLTWTDEGGGIYSTPMAEEPSWIWIGGLCAKLAETARIPITGRGSTTTITVNPANLAGFSNIVGSYLVAKDKLYRLSKRVTVTNYNAGSGVITVDGEIDVNDNVDLVLYNKFEYFVGNNEWAWEAGELRVKAAANPSTLDFRSSAYSYCFKTTSNTAFRSIEFKEYYQFCVWSEGGAIDVSACDFHDIRDTGVLIARTVTGANVSDNTFSRIGNCGITTRTATNSTFNRNTMSAIGMQANYGWQTMPASFNENPASVNLTGPVGCGIAYSVDIENNTQDGSGCEFNDNVISNVAYNPIHVSAGTTNKILRNTITSFLNRFSDGAGIYTYHPNITEVPHENTEIANNIISDGNGTQAINNGGIYCDRQTKAAYVHNNVVSDVGVGIILNFGTTDHRVEDNIVLNFTHYGVNFRQAASGSAGLFENNVNNTFTGNQIGFTGTTARCLYLYVISGSFPSWDPFAGGESDNNYYIAPSSTDIAVSTNDGHMTLAELRSNYGGDAASVYRDNVYQFIANTTNAQVNGTLSGFSTRSLLLASASEQSVNVGTTPNIQFERDDPFTISFWIKRNGNPSGASEVILSNAGPSNRGIQIAMLTDGRLTFGLRNTITTNQYQYATTKTFGDNAWHQVIFVKPTDFTDSFAVVDGEVDAGTESNTLTQTIVSTADWIIGNREGITNYFNGHLDQIAIWNSDQTANVAAIYNGGLTHDLADLADPPMPYWEIVDGPNDAAKYADNSPTQLHGTGTNSPTISTDVPAPDFVDVDLNPITNYTIPAYYALIYLT